MKGCVDSDTLSFDVHLEARPATQRGILSMVSSVFDPLGFVAPICSDRKRRDDGIPPELISSWSKWLIDLPKLSSLSVTRPVHPENCGHVVSNQLPHFSDASEVVYGSVCCLRLVNSQGDLHCSFLFSKSRLAPLKCV